VIWNGVAEPIAEEQAVPAQGGHGGDEHAPPGN
jgi:hypothetical protein